MGSNIPGVTIINGPKISPDAIGAKVFTAFVAKAFVALDAYVA
jgi:hypothetical protein